MPRKIAGAALGSHWSDHRTVAAFGRLGRQVGRLRLLQGLCFAHVLLAFGLHAAPLPGSLSALTLQVDTSLEKSRADRLFATYALNFEDPGSAASGLSEALQLYQKIGDKQGQANCRMVLGVLALHQRSFGEAELQLRSSRELLEELEDALGAWLATATLGITLTRARDFERADAEFRGSVELLEAFRRSPAPFRLDSFRVFQRISPVPLATIEPLTQMGGGWMQVVLKRLVLGLLEGLTRVSWSEALTAAGRFGESEQQLNEARVASATALGALDRLIWERFGDLRQAQGQLDKARENFLKALDSPDVGLGASDGDYELWKKLSEVELLLGNLPGALAANQSAFEQAKRRGDLVKQSLSLSDRARLHSYWNQYSEARSVLKSALETALRATDAYAEAVALNELGGIGLVSGQYEDAASHLQRAVRRFRDSGDPWGEISSRLTLAEVNDLLGRQDQFSRGVADALKLARQIGFEEAAALANFAAEFDRFRSGQPGTEGPTQAAKDFFKVLENSDNALIREFVANHEPLLAVTRLFSGVLPDEETTVARVSPPEGRKHLLFKALALVASGAAYHQRGLAQKAVERWREARGVFRQAGQKDMEALALFASGTADWSLGNRIQGLNSCREAVDLLDQSVVAQIKIDDLLAAFLGSERQRLYEVLVAMLAVSGKEDLAFHYAEKSRARALLSVLANQRLSPREGADARLVAEAETLRIRISRAAAGLEPNPRLERDRADYADLLTRLKLSNPEYATLASADAVTVSETQNLLPEGVTLISYFLGEAGSLAWVIDRGTFRQFRLNVSRGDFEEDSSDILRLPSCQGPSRGVVAADCQEPNRRAEELFAVLVAPLQPAIRYQTLILAPHGELHYVPFAALRDPATGRYLMESYALSYTPSVTALKHLLQKKVRSGGEILVLGDPKTAESALPGARDEALAIAQLFDVKANLGQDAGESLLRRVGSRVGLVHIAAHALYDGDHPLFSRIYLSPGEGQDGLLEAHEVFGELDLRGVQMVTLSACQTGEGRRSRGDDIVGLTQAFLHAGSSSVLATLWRIDDSASTRLMKRFYASVHAGTAFAEALREAQREALTEPGRKDPYFWAAFKLTGDPLSTWSPSPPARPAP